MQLKPQSFNVNQMITTQGEGYPIIDFSTNGDNDIT